MKRKIITFILVTCLSLLTACSKQSTQETTVTFATVVPNTETEESGTLETFSFLKDIESTKKNHEQSETETTEAISTETDETAETVVQKPWLSPEEIIERQHVQQQLVGDREKLYQNPPSAKNSFEIFKLDQQIVENNSYDFRNKKIVFIGDSITQGVTATVDANGVPISYVNYVDESLDFARVLNHGVGGRMFGTYGGEDMSLSSNFDNVINIDSDIIVVYAGVNDFLSNVPDKRFGNINDSVSTAGYCGELRYFMERLQQYFSDKEIFFVLSYPLNKDDLIADYSDINHQPDLNDYLDIQRQLAPEYGFHVIDLYNTGLIDARVPDINSAYLTDSIHPNDYGYCILGRHIAAELSLYFSQNVANES